MTDFYIPELDSLVERLEFFEGIRIATENRVRLATKEKGKDGKTYGLGLSKSDPLVVESLNLLTGIKNLEDNELVKQIERTMRQHPLYEWSRGPDRKGLGPKVFARLLYRVDWDPYWHPIDDRPRSVSELWQYCGHGDPERSRRRKGAQVEYSPHAKTRVWNIVASFMKQGSYRELYEKRRFQTAERLHANTCPPCGPSGTPAKAGTPWSAAHQNADAMRIMGKQFLLDLWLEAKRIHEAG